MVGGRQWAIKKFLRGYAVTIVTSALLVLILALLIWARLGDLYSIRDISKINPLITSGQNELVAVRDNNGISSFVKESSKDVKGGSASGESKGNSTDESDAEVGAAQSSDGGTSSNVNPGQNAGSSGGSLGGSSGNTGGTGGGGNTPSPTPGVFSAAIGNMWQADPISINLVGTSCKSMHDFYATITVQNAPGTVSYRWKQSNGVTGSTQQISFSAGDSSKTVSAPRWDISGSSGSSHSMTFEIVSPRNQQQTINFQHKCSLIVTGGGL